MLGVSLVTADDWILRHYAASGVGDIARLNYAKRLFAVPIAVLGQATGQASLPFFARLFNEKKLKEFAATVNDSVYRVSAASFLATGWMMAAAVPLIDLVYRRGKFLFADTQTSANLLLLVLAFAGAVVGAGIVCARVLCRRRHAYADGRGQRDYGGVAAGVFDSLSRVRSGRAGVGVGYWNWSESAGAGLAAASQETGSSRGLALGRVRKGRDHCGDRRRNQL